MKKLLALALAFAMVFAICTVAHADDKVHMVIACNSSDDTRIAILDRLAKNLPEDLPEYDVEIIYGGGGVEYENMMKTYNATGDLPDVYGSLNTIAAPLIASGSQLNLTEYIKADGFDQNFLSLDPMYYHGGIYSIQTGDDAYTIPVVFYDTAIFESLGLEEPTTWEELDHIFDVLIEAGIQPMGMDGTGWQLVNFFMESLMLADDPSTVTQLLNNETDWNDPRVNAAYDKMEYMLEKGVFGDRAAVAATADVALAWDTFAADGCAMLFDEYEIIGLNLKSQLNQGFRGLVLFLLTLKIADKAIHRRQYEQNEYLSAKRGAASLCSARTCHTLPTYILDRRSTGLSTGVDLYRCPLRYSTHVPLARAA